MYLSTFRAGSGSPLFSVLNVSQAQHPGPVCMADYVTQSLTKAAPGMLASILGSSIGPQQPTSMAIDASGKIATQLAGTEILFDGIPAPILSAGPNRVDVVVPFGIATSGTTAISILSYGVQVGALNNDCAPAAPKLFTVDGSGYGAAAWNQDGTPNSVTNPAHVGDIVTFYGTGVGIMIPAVADGAIPQSPQSITSSVITIGGSTAAVPYCTSVYSETPPASLRVSFNIIARRCFPLPHSTSSPFSRTQQPTHPTIALRSIRCT